MGEVCFNTAMTGYQEILTDPSYAGQIITFTFPHIGNVGVNDEDIETVNMAAASGVRGCVLKTDITDPSNYRATRKLSDWLKARGIIGIAGVDTRALAGADPREGHAQRGDRPPLAAATSTGRSCSPRRRRGPGWSAWTSPRKSPPARASPGTRRRGNGARATAGSRSPKHHVVAVDYGIKRNILRLLADHGCRVTVLPATATGEEILAHQPDGVFLSNGPGDPAATGDYAVPAIRDGDRRRACRPSASASATRCSGSRSAARP